LELLSLLSFVVVTDKAGLPLFARLNWPHLGLFREIFMPVAVVAVEMW
jgi:hypothetical protein